MINSNGLVFGILLITINTSAFEKQRWFSDFRLPIFFWWGGETTTKFVSKLVRVVIFVFDIIEWGGGLTQWRRSRACVLLITFLANHHHHHHSSRCSLSVFPFSPVIHVTHKESCDWINFLNQLPPSPRTSLIIDRYCAKTFIQARGQGTPVWKTIGGKKYEIIYRRKKIWLQWSFGNNRLVAATTTVDHSM